MQLKNWILLDKQKKKKKKKKKYKQNIPSFMQLIGPFSLLFQVYIWWYLA